MVRLNLRLLLLLACIATLALGTSIGADAPSEPPAENPTLGAETLKALKRLGQRVDLEFDRQAIPDALGFLSAISGLPLSATDSLEL